jgi:hypothetical protein
MLLTAFALPHSALDNPACMQWDLNIQSSLTFATAVSDEDNGDVLQCRNLEVPPDKQGSTRKSKKHIMTCWHNLNDTSIAASGLQS